MNRNTFSKTRPIPSWLKLWPKCFFRIVALCILIPNAKAMIYPLQAPYDTNYGNIAWSVPQSAGRAIGEMGALNGTSVAPYWIITAWHVVDPAQYNRNIFYSSDWGSGHLIDTKINLGNDMALCHLSSTASGYLTTPVPIYSPLHKTAVTTSDTLECYGQGYVEVDVSAPYSVSGSTRGWFPSFAGTGQNLRLGRATGVNWDGTDLNWTWNSSTSVGTDCPVFTTGDSGGGIFVGNELAGVISWASSQSSVNVSGSCDSLWLFDSTGSLNCSGGAPSLVSVLEGGILQHLSTIYNYISPPVKLCTYTASAVGWTPTPFLSGGGSQNIISTSSSINTSVVTDPAPQAVYQHMQVEYSPLTWTASNLLQTESYKVRVHLCSLQFTGSADISDQISVVDANGLYTYPYNIFPYNSGGYNQAWIIELPGPFTPDSSNQISGTIAPSAFGKSAALCGIEVVRIP